MRARSAGHIQIPSTMVSTERFLKYIAVEARTHGGADDNGAVVGGGGAVPGRRAIRGQEGGAAAAHARPRARPA
jgi:hypothetical protein